MFRVNLVVTSTCVGTHLRMLRHEQHVVEGQGGDDGRSEVEGGGMAVFRSMVGSVWPQYDKGRQESALTESK